jgi:NOL1/NOP2/sun family putative RNA methylase
MKTYLPKPKYIERISKLLDNSEDINNYLKITQTTPKKSIRVNTLKISTDKLTKKLKNKGWKFSQPFKDNPEILIIKSELNPGELGKTKEHILGEYYIQELTSMMPILNLQPKADDSYLDIAASPGSKTTQSAISMKNKGTVIANDISIGRISVLSANLERLGITNTIITREEGEQLCNKLKKQKFSFDKILLDAPCSGEGKVRTTPRTFLEWSEKLLFKMSRTQKRLIVSAFEILKPEGEMIYSTCTHAPEENELIIQHLIDNFPNQIEVLPIKLPLKTREGITEWNNQELNSELKKAVRIYPQDNDTEGFFLCKIKKKIKNLTMQN